MGRNQQHRTGRTRGRRIFIRVSDQEFEEIRAAADMKGVSVSRYLVEAHETCTDLEAAKKKCETGPIVEKLEAIRTEIWHIGHNVNQIARNTNRDMSASMDDEHSAAKAVRDCARLFVQASDTIVSAAAADVPTMVRWRPSFASPPSLTSGSRERGDGRRKTKGLGISAKAFADRALPIHVDDYMSVRSRSQARRRRKRRAPSYHCWNVSSGRGHDGLDQTVYRNEQARSGKTQREIQTDT